jgi:hypothetical protein
VISEADFESAVVDLAHVFGWKVAGFRPARTLQGWRTAVKHDGQGFPDLVMVNEKRHLILFVELKATRGRLGPGQAEWGDTIRRAMIGTPDVRHHVWRPADADDIARTLTAGKITTWRLE